MKRANVMVPERRIAADKPFGGSEWSIVVRVTPQPA